MTEMRARLVDKDGNPLGTASNPLKISGDVGGGVPDGGTTGQVLQKKSDADQDVEWGDGSGASTAWGSITGTLSDQTDLGNVLDGKASRTDSDLTLYVYEDATGDADGSSKANGFTTLQAAIDAIPDVAQNVTIIVCKGSTNYLGQTTTIQKASVKSLTIRGEFYAYEACDANVVAGKVVDADADFSNFAVGDRVVCTHYSGTVGSSSIDDYFYATITEVGSGYVQTSEGTKIPTTGWTYLINQTQIVSVNDIAGRGFIESNNMYSITIVGISLVVSGQTGNGRCALAFFGNGYSIVTHCIFVGNQGILSTGNNLHTCAYNYMHCYYIGVQIAHGARGGISRTVFTGTPAVCVIHNGGGQSFLIYNYLKTTHASGKAIKTDMTTDSSKLVSCYIDSSFTYGAYGYNITLDNCTNNAATPVYNLTSGGSIEEWDGQALPSIDDATGGQVLALKSDKSALEFATVDLDTLSAEPKSNLIINGDFSVAQRGTTFNSTTWRKNDDDSYLLDRWLLLSDGNDIVDVTQISGAFSRSRYALQAEVETANKRFGFCQIIEANTSIPLRGQKISVSFAAKTVSAKLVENVRVAVLEWTSTADAVTSDVVSAWGAEGTNPTWATNWTALNTPANLALTTSEQTFKVENLTVGASCNNLAVFIWIDDTDCAVDDILQLGEVQLVRGSVVPEFVANDDFVRCLRRYQVLPVHTGWGSSTTWSRIYIDYLLPMATLPTAAAIIQVWTGSAWANPTNLSYRISNSGVVLAIEYNTHVFVGHGSSQYPNMIESGIIRLEAEL